jgi:FMN hydrolase / 5-amino-6-(5-phospho-D-ribitylamino)uracil phosphatase
MQSNRWIVLDVGETLIDETRVWSTWADVLGITRLTFLAGLGATLARGGDYRDVFDLFGITDWRQRLDEHEARYGGFQVEDLYPDALPAIDALRADGCRVAVIANQPAFRAAQLRSIGVDVEVMAMSEAMEAAKPEAAFYQRTLDLLGHPTPDAVAYVGDRVDNDVLPSIRAGMRPVWLRRGPWGWIQSLSDDAAGVLVVGSLTELVERQDELWGPRPGA